MTRRIGHEEQERALRRAAAGGRLHHGWILAGPRGLGKASFAIEMARWLLDHGDADKTAALIAAGSHPDLRILRRLPKEPPKEPGEPVAEADLKRNITVDQVRELGPALSTRPSLARRRLVVIDSVDDLEREGANALLKNLEEPPPGTVFFGVSHAPGRLLPTIRSRCQLLRFEPLDDERMAAAIRQALPDVDDNELETLMRAGEGSPGKALSFAGLRLSELERSMRSIATGGDRSNSERAKLAAKLALKAEHPRYEAFLRRVPAFIAERARAAPVEALPDCLSAYQEATALGARAMPLNIDKQAVVLEMGRILASLAANRNRPHA